MTKHVYRKHIKDADTLERFLIGLDIGTDDIAFDTIKSAISSQTELTNNDRHASYEVKGHLPFTGVLYHIRSPTEKELGAKNKVRSFIVETYQQYLDKKSKITENNLRWIYNIIDGKSETENIIFNDDDYILIPDISWNGNNKPIEQLHVLAIVKDKSLMSLRDLQQTHIPLLKSIRNDALVHICNTYNVTQDKIKMFVHYLPSVYLLHIHFVHIDVNYIGTSIDKCHNLDHIIQNLQLDNDYYKADMRIAEFSEIKKNVE